VKKAAWNTSAKFVLVLGAMGLLVACQDKGEVTSDAETADRLAKVGSVEADAGGQEGMSGMSGMSGMEGMSGMSGMSGMEGMSGMTGMSGMEGMSGESGGDQTALATSKGCLACHSVDNKIVGPAYKDIAAKYKGDASALDTLVAKVKAGGKGNWGEVPMPPNPAVSDEDLKTLVTWVLSL
jgi:cytochrome c551/c552